MVFESREQRDQLYVDWRRQHVSIRDDAAYDRDSNDVIQRGVSFHDGNSGCATSTDDQYMEWDTVFRVTTICPLTDGVEDFDPKTFSFPLSSPKLSELNRKMQRIGNETASKDACAHPGHDVISRENNGYCAKDDLLRTSVQAELDGHEWPTRFEEAVADSIIISNNAENKQNFEMLYMQTNGHRELSIIRSSRERLGSRTRYAFKHQSQSVTSSYIFPIVYAYGVVY